MSSSCEEDKHEGGKGQDPLVKGNQVNQGGGIQPGGDLLGKVGQETTPGKGDDKKEAVSSGESEKGRVGISPVLNIRIQSGVFRN